MVCFDYFCEAFDYFCKTKGIKLVYSLKMKRTVYNTILLFFTIYLCSCTHTPPQVVHQDYGIYCEDTAMAHFITEPDRALVLIDSAVILGETTPARGQYLKAIVMADGKCDIDSCIAMCKDMIEHKVWVGDRDDDPESFQVSIYRLMATASLEVGNHMNVLRYAREGVKIAHGNPYLLGDEADLLSRMGLVMCHLGQYKEGIDAMRRAEKLAKNDNTWSSLLSYLNNSKKMYYACDMTKNYAEAKRVVFKALKRIDYVRHNPKKIKYMPDAMLRDSTAFEEFADFYQVPLYCYLTNIYSNEQKTDSALFWLNKVKGCSQSDNPNLNQSLIAPLIQMGRYDEAAQMIEAKKLVAGADTTCTEYITLLKQELQLYMKTGRHQEASLLSQRIINATDSINAHDVQMMIADAATQCQLQEEQMLRKDAEDRFLTTIIVLGLIICIIVGVFIFIYIRKLMAKHSELKQILDVTQEELEYMIEDKKDEDASKSQAESLEDIYRRAVEYMEASQPYRNPKFDIYSLGQDLGVNRSYLSNAVNSYSGMNFRSWLGKYRVEYAKKVLLSNPNITNDDLAIECGFDNRTTLYRQFKNFENVAPSKWLKLQSE